MIMKAIRELDIEPSTSFIVGDRHSDLEAGARAGVSHGYILGEAGINKINTAREIIFGLGPEF
jgi:histidinol phosphatase-like enzyme